MVAFPQLGSKRLFEKSVVPAKILKFIRKLVGRDAVKRTHYLH